MSIIFLADFNPIKPDFGLIFWTILIFGLFWFLIGKFAFRPIAEALKKREDDIQRALDQAQKAKDDIASLKADNDRIIQEANEERGRILKEAKETSQTMINDSKEKAKSEAQKIVEQAKLEINSQKAAAIHEVKNMIGLETVSLAEKVLGRELSDKGAQASYVADEVKRINLN